jgi:hypothetical protein
LFDAGGRIELERLRRELVERIDRLRLDQKVDAIDVRTRHGLDLVAGVLRARMGATH